MAQVTVQQLAKVVGASSERLLTQMKEAGLPHTAAEEAVSDEDKQTLLKYLKRSHGESTDAPKRITLKRKTISTLRTSSSQGRKTVNVEVRKKRTYVKRDAENLDEAETQHDDEIVRPGAGAAFDVAAGQPAAGLKRKRRPRSERNSLQSWPSSMQASTRIRLTWTRRSCGSERQRDASLKKRMRQPCVNQRPKLGARRKRN